MNTIGMYIHKKYEKNVWLFFRLIIGTTGPTGLDPSEDIPTELSYLARQLVIGFRHVSITTVFEPSQRISFMLPMYLLITTKAFEHCKVLY